MRIMTSHPPYGFQVHEGDELDPMTVAETWDENVYHLHRGLFCDTGVFLDLGANIGVTATYAVSLNDGGAPPITVVAVEPSPGNLGYLQRNLDDNGVADRVKVVPMAVSDKRMTAPIQDDHARSRLLEAGDWPGGDLVPVITLADALDMCGTGVDACKLDVEGSEYPIIAGADVATLRRIGYLAMEFHATEDVTFGTMLTKLAYVFNSHFIGTPDRGGYYYGYRYDL